MSTYWGFVCTSHDPVLESERWLNHGEDALIDLYLKVRANEWPRAADLDPRFALAYGEQLAPMVAVPADSSVAGYAVPVPPPLGGGAPPWQGPLDWLQEHPRCEVVLRNEYGDTRQIARTLSGSQNLAVPE